jgi:hypothetical protein
MKRSTLLLLLMLGMALSACGKDEPEQQQQPEKNFGAGVAEGYKDMMNEARHSVDQANRHTEETEQRSHPDE